MHFAPIRPTALTPALMRPRMTFRGLLWLFFAFTLWVLSAPTGLNEQSLALLVLLFLFFWAGTLTGVMVVPLAVFAGLILLGAQHVPLWSSAGQALVPTFGCLAGLMTRRAARDYRHTRDEIVRLGQEKAALHSELRRANKELNKSVFELLALFEFTNILGTTPHLEELSKRMVDAIERIVIYDACTLTLTGEERSNLRLVSCKGLKPRATSESLPWEELVRWVTRTCQARLIQDFQLETDVLPDAVFGTHFRSLIAVPLVIQSQCIGVLAVAQRAPDAFSQDDLRLMFIIANQAALAVQNARLYQEAFQASITDGLTGLYNHNYFREQLASMLEGARASNGMLSLLFIDIDLFKETNDRHGHLVGDEVLKKVAAIIRRHVPVGGLAARYGGEEFAVILPGCPCPNAAALAEETRLDVCREPVVELDTASVRVSVSIGVATFPLHTTDHSNPITALVAAADEQLLQGAKQGGRNKVSFPA